MSDFEPYDRAITNLRRLGNSVRGAQKPVRVITVDVNAIEADRRAWKERALAPDPPPDPTTGADEVAQHVTGQPLAFSVAAMTGSAIGGLSVLMVGPGHHGPLELSSAHAALLTRRVLRIAGPFGSSVGAIRLPEGSGIQGATVELWRVGLRGEVRIIAPGFELRMVQGSSAKALMDAGPGVPL